MVYIDQFRNIDLVNSGYFQILLKLYLFNK